MKLKTLFICALGLIVAIPALASTATGPLDTGVGSGSGVQGTVMGAPTASPVAGTYNSTQSVVLSSPGASWISYTTDGATSTCSNASTTGAISVTSSKTIKAISCYANNVSSTVASFAYVLQCATQSVSNGTVGAYPTCAITCNSGYTLSGSSCVASGGGGGGGGGSGDTVAPTISQIAVTTLADNYAVISWKTNESSLSWINYGTSTNYGLMSKTAVVYVSSHSLKLTELLASTVYHYQVKSQDVTGNIGSYTDKTFTTLSAGAAPIITTIVTTPVTTLTPISQMTPTELQTEILRLTNLLVQLQAQVKAMPAVPVAPTVVPPAAIPSAGKFTTRLSIGAKSDDVRALQEFLKAQGSDIYPEGLVTGYFGALTKKAVGKFQEKYGIAKPGDAGYGYVGPRTRAKINELLGLQRIFLPKPSRICFGAVFFGVDQVFLFGIILKDMNKVIVTSLDKKLKKKEKRNFEKKIKLAAQKILRILGKNNVLVEIYLINSQKMRFLNKKFRGKDKTTTILSFEEPRNFIYPHTKQGLAPSAQKCHLSLFGVGVYPRKIKRIGEIYLNLTNDRRLMTNDSRKSLVVSRKLLIHGLLHLFGYNHKKKSDRIKMEKTEQKLLQKTLNSKL